MSQLEQQIATLKTEQRNSATLELDRLPTLEMVRLINEQSKGIVEAVGEQAPAIAQAVDLIAERMRQGGRLFYIGAGTSGRLGVLDASECPPTFSIPFDRVIGIIAGGDRAIRKAVELAEDSPILAAQQLEEYCLTPQDVVCAIAASGRTPYCVGGLRYARSRGAATLCITNNRGSVLSQHSDIAIEVEVGPEVISGSTRMKAGTAQKMVLNLLSTGAMIRLGRVYSNLMVDLRATNEKLVMRSKAMLRQIVPEATEEAIDNALKEAGGSVKVAAVMLAKQTDASTAKQLLEKHQGFLRAVLEGEE